MKGTISISRFTSNKAPYRGVEINLRDELSSTRIATITMNIEEFGNAISGLGETDCVFELGNLESVGKKLEVKTVLVKTSLKSRYGVSDEDLMRLLAPHETDGWEGSLRDMKNNHNWDKGGIKVAFHRYVEAE
jgi:hypothetical protein